MSSIHKAECACGYRTSVLVGGTRADFLRESTFPYYCKSCGIVDVNIRDQELHCPDCSSLEISQYGLEPISTRLDDSYAVLQNFNYEAYRYGNLCPKCKKKNLEFKNAEMRFG